MEEGAKTEEKVDPSFQEEINKAIEKEIPIKIRLYALLDSTEANLNYVIEKILQKYQREDLIGPVYTSVKELALNGCKANVKRVLFKELGLNMDDDEEYEKGMEVFKKNLSEEWIFEYAKKAKEEGLHVDVYFDYNPYRLIVEVENNRPIGPKEDRRIREKFKKAMQYDDIAQFFLEAGDQTEGAGMGITLVTMLLKAQGMDPHLFTIRSDFKSKTVAKVEFPLHPEYKTSRERYQNLSSSPS